MVSEDDGIRRNLHAVGQGQGELSWREWRRPDKVGKDGDLSGPGSHYPGSLTKYVSTVPR